MQIQEIKILFVAPGPAQKTWFPLTRNILSHIKSRSMGFSWEMNKNLGVNSIGFPLVESLAQHNSLQRWFSL